MAWRREPFVVDEAGVSGRIREFIVDDEGAGEVSVELASGVRVTMPADMLHPEQNGGYRIETRWAELASVEALDLPIVVEEVRVGKHVVDRERLKIRRHVVTEDKLVETPLWHERITVEHVPCNAYVEQVPGPRQEGDTLIIPRVEEEVVVIKRLVVREELRIRVIREQRVERTTVSVRRHEIEVERDLDAATSPGSPNSKKH